MHISHLLTFTETILAHETVQERNSIVQLKHEQELKQKHTKETEKNLKDFEGATRIEPEREMWGFLEVKRVVADE